MLKKNTAHMRNLLILLALMSCMQLGAQTVQKAPAENYELKAGHLSMTIDAANGARITSFKYDGQEVLSQMNQPNMYGSTFWTSPQKVWNWPPIVEHDMLPYAAVQQGNSILMTSQVPLKLPLRITKQFTADPFRECMIVTYTIKNEGKEACQVAPWEITRVPAEGTITFQAQADGIWPAGLMDFKQDGELVSYEIDQRENQRKINANGTGWIRYEHNGLVFTRCFQDLATGQPAPGEDEIQVYVHNGKAYVELEGQGAYTRLEPGSSLHWTVRWFLQPR